MPRARLDLVYRDTLHFNVQPLGTARWFPRYLAVVYYSFMYTSALSAFVFIVVTIVHAVLLGVGNLFKIKIIIKY